VARREDRQGREVMRELAIDDEPNEFLFVPKLGKLAWILDNRVVLFGKNGAEVGSFVLIEHSSNGVI
jgi:hypothetical protein